MDSTPINTTDQDMLLKLWITFKNFYKSFINTVITRSFVKKNNPSSLVAPAPEYRITIYYLGVQSLLARVA